LGGKYKLSKINYKKFLDLSGNNLPAKVSYANSLFKAKDYAELLNVISEIQAVDNSRNYLNRLAAYAAFDMKPADYNKSISYIEKYMQNATPEKIILRDHLYYGRSLLKLKQDTNQIDKGISVLLKAYELDTTDNDLYSDIAKQAYDYKRFYFSERLLRRKLMRGDAASADYLNLGKVYYQTKRYGRADSTFNALIAKDPKFVTAYVWSANAAYSQDPEMVKDFAKTNYEKVIEVGMVDSVKNGADIFAAYNYLFSYYLFAKDKSKQDYNKSLSFAQKMTTLDPKNTQWVSQGNKNIGVAYFFIANSYNLKKDYKTAISFYNKVLDYDPNNEDAKKQIQALNKFLNASK